MNTEKLTVNHSQAVHGLLCECFATPWSLDSVRELLDSPCGECFGIFDDDLLVGYVALEWVLDEGSLTDLAVKPTYRRRGLASLLMEKLLESACGKKLSFVTLEVRASNTPAIDLYRIFGFKEVGRRPDYYRSPTEDALLMTKYM